MLSWPSPLTSTMLFLRARSQQLQLAHFLLELLRSSGTKKISEFRWQKRSENFWTTFKFCLLLLNTIWLYRSQSVLRAGEILPTAQNHKGWSTAKSPTPCLHKATSATTAESLVTGNPTVQNSRKSPHHPSAQSGKVKTEFLLTKCPLWNSLYKYQTL